MKFIQDIAAHRVDDDKRKIALSPSSLVEWIKKDIRLSLPPIVEPNNYWFRHHNIAKLHHQSNWIYEIHVSSWAIDLEGEIQNRIPRWCTYDAFLFTLWVQVRVHARKCEMDYFCVAMCWESINRKKKTIKRTTANHLYNNCVSRWDKRIVCRMESSHHSMYHLASYVSTHSHS